MSSENFIKRFINNPAIRALVIFISSGWIILEIVEYFIQNFGLDERIRIILLVILLALLPPVIFFSWYATRKQKDLKSSSENQARSDLKPEEERLIRLLHIARKPGIYLPGLLLLSAIVISGIFRTRHQAELRWVSEEAIPTIYQAVEESDFITAYETAVKATKIDPEDTLLTRLWTRFSYYTSLQTDPPGAHVYWTDYQSGDNNWRYLGKTPLDSIRLPWEFVRLKVEKEGFQSFHLGNLSMNQVMKLSREGEDFPGMVPVPRGDYSIEITGLDHLGTVEVEGFWIDKYEVSNLQYKVFVDSGGYENPKFWKNTFKKDGQVLSWEEAMKEYVDATGRPGPSTWELGSYKKDQENHPVSGICWYESAAYAEFMKKDLPTIFHWNIAARVGWSHLIIPQSNFSGKGSAALGTYSGISPTGTFDMAGNVREWCSNKGRDQHFILGGGWDDQEYMFQDAYTQSSFNRYQTNGFRCVKYLPAEKNLSVFSRPIEHPFRDYNTEKPLHAEILKLYKKMYDYDRTELDVRTETVDSSASDYIREKISFNTAYGNERMSAFLFLPRKGNPPYQVVVFFPGSNDLLTRSSHNLNLRSVDFILKNGRAVLYPVYKSTFERGDGLSSCTPDSSNNYKDHVIMWSKDLGRSIDYLESREDIDSERIALYGVSWGGRLGPLLTAIEKRVQVCILYVGGLSFQRPLPEVDPFYFLPLVDVPLLMLNGRYDHFFPYETSQIPLFELIGTSPENKRHVVYETGHFVPQNQLIKEIFEWLDRYLGPVK